MSWTGKWLHDVRQHIDIYWYFVRREPDGSYLGIALHDGHISGGLLTVTRQSDLEALDEKYPHNYKIDDPKDKRDAIKNIFRDAED